MPSVFAVNVARYSPSRSPDPWAGISSTSPEGPVPNAVTLAPFHSSTAGAATAAAGVRVAPGSTRAVRGRPSAVAGHERRATGVVHLRKRGIDDAGDQREGFTRFDAVGERMHVDGIGHLVDEPSQHLAPVVLVRLVLESDRGVHLPQPGVLHGLGD